MYDSPVHGCTQEQTVSHTFLPSFDNAKWPSLSRKIVEIQKFGYHGNVTSHFSLLSDVVFRVGMQILMEQWLGLCWDVNLVLVLFLTLGLTD